MLAASRCFYEIFKDDPASSTAAHSSISAGQWDIPLLRQLLETIIPDACAMNGFEVEQDCPETGRRTMLLNARLVRYEECASPTILLAFKDITERRVIEREKQALLEHTEELLAQHQTLLREMGHRIANSLQIIASILLLKAGAVASEETRDELQDAHQRVMSVAAVQSHLHAVDGIDQIEVGAYLTKLMRRPGGVDGRAAPGDRDRCRWPTEGTLPTSHAVSLGLIVTELVINAIKYAFPDRPRLALASSSLSDRRSRLEAERLRQRQRARRMRHLLAAGWARRSSAHWPSSSRRRSRRSPE